MLLEKEGIHLTILHTSFFTKQEHVRIAYDTWHGAPNQILLRASKAVNSQRLADCMEEEQSLHYKESEVRTATIASTLTCA